MINDLLFCFLGLPVAQPPLEFVDSKVDQGVKVDPVLSDDWQRESQVIPCSQEFKNNILRVNGQEASIHQVLFYSSDVIGKKIK